MTFSFDITFQGHMNEELDETLSAEAFKEAYEKARKRVMAKVDMIVSRMPFEDLGLEYISLECEGCD